MNDWPRVTAFWIFCSSPAASPLIPSWLELALMPMLSRNWRSWAALRPK